MPADFHHLRYILPKFKKWQYRALMITMQNALGFGENDKAQFRFHVLSLFYHSGWRMVKKAFPNLSRPTVYRWKRTYELSGKKLSSLLPKTTRPKNTRRMQTPVPVLALIKSLREEYPRLGKEKIKLFVDSFCQANNLPSLSSSTIGKVIKRNSFFFYDTKKPKRSSFTLKQRIKLCPQLKDITPGYLQVDGFKFWYGERYYYFLTAVEIVTRQAFVKLVPQPSSKQASLFLKEIISQCRVIIHTIQTDNGGEFEKYFKQALKELSIIHLYSYPKHPKTNGFVERFNWTVQDEFLFTYEDLLLYEEEFKKKLEEWMIFYNQKRPHQSLGYLTPYQYQEKRGFVSKVCN